MTLTYTLNPFDRATLMRGDEARVQSLLTGGAARIVPVWNQKNLVDETPRLQTLTYGEINVATATLVFLGLDNDTPWFVAGLPDSEHPPTLKAPGEFKDLNSVVGLLSGDEAAILAYARAMVIWHSNHRHCGRCGAAAAITESGHSRTCTACTHRSFPRTDPVVITLITRGDKCLLGRQAVWPPGMYSCIAGFVEPGETLENAVRREAGEETGVDIGDVSYVASQPWPFPASIMLGFRAHALTTDIQRNDNELEDCRRSARRPCSFQA
jgi:NAD+ diphosphatase